MASGTFPKTGSRPANFVDQSHPPSEHHQHYHNEDRLVVAQILLITTSLTAKKSTTTRAVNHQVLKLSSQTMGAGTNGKKTIFSVEGLSQTDVIDIGRSRCNSDNGNQHPGIAVDINWAVYQLMNLAAGRRP
uniref:Uncharacterized protein n=1 Tax=Odontella aurita TaxID=265563 RepID=A0A7S4NF44_9STRA